MKLTKEQMAERLNGRQYGDEVDSADSKLAKDNGLVIVYGASDDNTEFRGVIDDEIGCYGGGRFFLKKEGVFNAKHNCDCHLCGINEIAKTAKTIEALWCEEGEYSWTFKTTIPHATFEITEDGSPFCRGIVFSINDL